MLSPEIELQYRELLAEAVNDEQKFAARKRRGYRWFIIGLVAWIVLSILVRDSVFSPLVTIVMYAGILTSYTLTLHWSEKMLWLAEKRHRLEMALVQGLHS